MVINHPKFQEAVDWHRRVVDEEIEKKAVISCYIFTAVAILNTVIISKIMLFQMATPMQLLSIQPIAVIPALIAGSILAPKAGKRLISIMQKDSHEPWRFEIALERFWMKRVWKLID